MGGVYTICVLLMICVLVNGEQNKLKREKREAVASNVDIHATRGSISSPGYHDGVNYPLNVDKTWTLHLPNDSAYSVILNITFMDIEEEEKCEWDYLEFDNDYSQRLCGNQNGVYTVETASEKTKMRFVSDFYVTKRGFTAYYSIERLANPCDKSQCVNNASCSRLSNSDYKCICAKHYTGKYCQEFKKSECEEYPCLIFEDNFDFINHYVWQHEITLGGGGNWEFQHYTNNRTNSYCKDGVLYIKPTLTNDGKEPGFLESARMEVWGGGPHDRCTGNQFYGCERQGTPSNVLNPIQSARLRSSRGFNIKFGKVEIEAKLPVGDWLWPAIWMMPTYATYGGWPSSGEIDIMESRGNLNYTTADGKPNGVDHVGSTLHFGSNYFHNGFEKTTVAKRLRDGRTFADDFHRYAVEWTEDYIKCFIDDEMTLHVEPDEGGFWKYGDFEKNNMLNPWRYGTKMSPFDQEFYVILNVAVGGFNYFSDSNIGPRPKPWKDADKTAFWRAKDEWYPTWNPFENDGEDAALKINYVKAWKLKP